MTDHDNLHQALQDFKEVGKQPRKKKGKRDLALVSSEAVSQPVEAPPPTVAAQPVPTPPKNKGGRPKKSEKTEEIDEKTLKELQGSLSGVSRKAIKKLKALLDNENVRVQMQAALGIIRATVSALTRDTLPPGAGAEIHIHTSAQVAVVQPQPSGPPQPEQGEPAKATGRPITIVN